MKLRFKLLAISVLAIVTTQSCEKKNQKADQLLTDTTSAPIDTSSTSSTSVEPTNTVPEVNSSTTEQSKALTNLVLSEDTFDFGDIKKGDVKTHDYEITNTGTNPLIISEVKPGCGCTVPEFTKEPILPGKKGKVTLKFESQAFDGAVQKTAQVFANVEKSPIMIGFTANIK